MEATTAVGLILALLGPLLIARIGEGTQPGRGRMLRLLGAQLALCGLVMLVLAIAFSIEGLAWRQVGLQAPAFTSVAYGLALAGFFVYIYGPAAYWLLSRLHLGGFEHGLAKLEGLPLWYLLFAVLIGGAAEEILYRGYAFERLTSITGSLWLAGAILLVLFAIAHVPMWGWPAGLTMLVSGGILTAWYAWHRDLNANIIAHCLTDLVGIVLAPAIQKRNERKNVPGVFWGCVGLALWVGTWPFYMAVPVVFLFLNFFHIPREDRLLRETFGERYLHYSKEVRRWL